MIHVIIENQDHVCPCHGSIHRIMQHSLAITATDDRNPSLVRKVDTDRNDSQLWRGGRSESVQVVLFYLLLYFQLSPLFCEVSNCILGVHNNILLTTALLSIDTLVR